MGDDSRASGALVDEWPGGDRRGKHLFSANDLLNVAFRHIYEVYTLYDICMSMENV
jgi:hypothetical protein